MRTPDWIGKPASEWPASARNAYGLMVVAAQRRLEAERQAQFKDNNRMAG